MTRLPRLAACALSFLIVLAGASPASAAPAADRAAGLPTRWNPTQAPTDQPDGVLADISCASTTFCLAVGSIFVAGLTGGFKAPLAEVRDRSGWRRVATTGLPSTITSLGRVSCGRAGRCLALTTRFHAQPVWWTGRRWRVAPLPRPMHDRPVDVDCASGASCMVVGERGNRAWSWRWSAGHWTSVPSSREKVDYRAVSCPRTTLCRAVGVRHARDGSRRAVVSRWSGRRWSLRDLPGGRHGALYAIDCSTTTSCTAAGHVGGYFGHLLIETLTGNTWQASRPRLPRGTNPSSISCRSPIRCTAAVVWPGHVDDRSALAGRGNDGVWRIGRTTDAEALKLSAISCTPDTCTTVGNAGILIVARILAAFRGRGLSPRREAVPAPRSPAEGEISDVSCTEDGFCAAAKEEAAHPLVHPAGGRWRRAGGEGPSDLQSVSCSSPRFCMAIVHRAARWDGTHWLVAPTPARSGRFWLDDIDCLKPTWCDAVGARSWSGNALIEHWDGVSWRVVTPPRPKLPGLEAVDCVSTTDCLAAGGATVLRSNGTHWRVLGKTGLPPRADVVDLSCSDTDACLAVYSSGRVARFDGTRFTTTPVGPGFRPYMIAVDCRAADACVAVGRGGARGKRGAAVQSWDGTRWRTVPGPFVAHTWLESVSCSGRVCRAGGQVTAGPDGVGYPLLAVIR